MSKPQSDPSERRLQRESIYTTHKHIDNQELISKVLNEPDSDAPRLQYAEFLKSRTGTGPLEREAWNWGDFIERQIAIARGREKPDWQPLAPPADGSPARDLVMRGFLDDEVRHFRFSRGFIEQISVRADVFCEAAEELFSLAPIRMLDVRNLTSAPALSRSPHLARIRAVALLDDRIDDAMLEPWIDSPFVGEIRYFEVDPTCISDDALVRLSTSRAWANLAVLRLRTSTNPGWMESVKNAEDVRQILGFTSTSGRNSDLRDTPRRVTMHPGPRVAAIESRVGYRTCLHPERGYGTYRPTIESVVLSEHFHEQQGGHVNYGPLPSLVQRAREGRCPYCGHDEFYRVEHTDLYGSPFDVYMTTDNCRLCRSSWNIAKWPERRAVHVSNIIPSHLYNTQDDYDQ